MRPPAGDSGLAAVAGTRKLPSVLRSPAPPGPWQKLAGSVRDAVLSRKGPPLPAGERLVSALQGLFPVLRWGRSYRAAAFWCDLMAGLTLASLGIPQSIGYASLAMLPPQYGLYTSVVPPLIYAAMGSSKEIAIGPVAVVSLLLSAMVQKTVNPLADAEAYRKMVFTATFFAGLFQAGFGLLRLGFLVDFLSHAAVVGFMGGAAIVIGLQQLKGLLGITHFTSRTDAVSVIRSLWVALVHERPWHPGNFILGCSFLIFILTTRFIGKRRKKLFWLPAISPLISVILSTLVVFVTRADKHGVKTIQYIKGGLNPSSLEQLTFTRPFVGEAAKIGLIAAVIALTEAIAVGRSFASMKGYSLDGNKEMVAMGFMNLAGSLSSCYIATGSFSRTAVNVGAGCNTAVSNVVMAVAVLLSLQLLTKLLYYTPAAILASVILSALPGLVDAGEARRIWKVDKMDFLSCAGAFAGVLFGSVEIGLLAAVSISLSRIVLNSLRPRVEVLGRLEGADGVFCSVGQFPMAAAAAELLVIRIGSSFLSFINANFVRERILASIQDHSNTAAVKDEEKPDAQLSVVIIDISSVMNVDTSGIKALEEVHGQLVSQGLQMAVVNPGLQVVHKMRLASFVERVGEHCFFLTIAEAAEAFDARLARWGI